MEQNAEPPLTDADAVSRELPARIVIPPIRGEMVHLRPAAVEDLPRMDELGAYCGASRITGKDMQAERAVVHAWVRRSVAWAEGRSETGVDDPESRRTIAWSILTDADHDDDGTVDAAETGNVIGMIFLIDIDGWARSARIQIVLGKDYRGRGYSRDAMPRVMTFGFAPEPAGLGMHRIWVGVPEKNTRSISVYQSLGFVPSGTSRDALWDAENNKYQDLIVMDTLADEYDPIASLDAFGMHVQGGAEHARALGVHPQAQRRGTTDAAGHPGGGQGPDAAAGRGTGRIAAAGARPAGTVRTPRRPTLPRAGVRRRARIVRRRGKQLAVRLVRTQIVEDRLVAQPGAWPQTRYGR